MHLGRGRLILLAVLLLIAVGLGVVLQAKVAANTESPGPPASIVFSTTLPQLYPFGYLFPTMAGGHSGRIYLAGDGVGVLAANNRRVTPLFNRPRGTEARNKMTISWVRAIGAGGGVATSS